MALNARFLLINVLVLWENKTLLRFIYSLLDQLGELVDTLSKSILNILVDRGLCRLWNRAIVAAMKCVSVCILPWQSQYEAFTNLPYTSVLIISIVFTHFANSSIRTLISSYGRSSYTWTCLHRFSSTCTQSKTNKSYGTYQLSPTNNSNKFKTLPMRWSRLPFRSLIFATTTLETIPKTCFTSQFNYKLFHVIYVYIFITTNFIIRHSETTSTAFIHYFPTEVHY